LRKLRRGSRASDGTHRPPTGDRRADRRPPSSTVTAWLRQGLRAGICPLCRVAHKADREYIWHFFDEGVDQGESIDTVRRACGFCAEHVEMLRRIEVDGMNSTLSLSTLFVDSMVGIVEDLDSLTPEARFRRGPCPACANRRQALQVNAQYLLDELATSPGHRKTFEDSPGLCFAHFELVWEVARAAEDRRLILEVQRRATRTLLSDLREHVRKHDDKYRHEPKGAERDSWRRAILLTAGWPPPAESAAQPERLR
jgi:hypothetical protein